MLTIIVQVVAFSVLAVILNMVFNKEIEFMELDHPILSLVCRCGIYVVSAMVALMI